MSPGSSSGTVRGRETRLCDLEADQIAAQAAAQADLAAACAANPPPFDMPGHTWDPVRKRFFKKDAKTADQPAIRAPRKDAAAVSSSHDPSATKQDSRRKKKRKANQSTATDSVPPGPDTASSLVSFHQAPSCMRFDSLQLSTASAALLTSSQSHAARLRQWKMAGLVAAVRNWRFKPLELPFVRDADGQGSSGGRRSLLHGAGARATVHTAHFFPADEARHPLDQLSRIEASGDRASGHLVLLRGPSPRAGGGPPHPMIMQVLRPTFDGRLELISEKGLHRNRGGRLISGSVMKQIEHVGMSHFLVMSTMVWNASSGGADTNSDTGVAPLNMPDAHDWTDEFTVACDPKGRFAARGECTYVTGDYTRIYADRAIQNSCRSRTSPSAHLSPPNVTRLACASSQQDHLSASAQDASYR